MSERVVVRQNIDFETEFLAQNPAGKEGALRKVKDIHDITPYDKFLASLGAGTAIVVNTCPLSWDSARRDGVTA